MSTKGLSHLSDLSETAGRSARPGRNKESGSEKLRLIGVPWTECSFLNSLRGPKVTPLELLVDVTC